MMSQNPFLRVVEAVENANKRSNELSEASGRAQAIADRDAKHPFPDFGIDAGSRPAGLKNRAIEDLRLIEQNHSQEIATGDISLLALVFALKPWRERGQFLQRDIETKDTL